MSAADIETVRNTIRVVQGERDHAHAVLRALRLAGHVPQGAWRRLVNCVVGLESEGDSARAEAAALAIVWEVEQEDRR